MEKLDKKKVLAVVLIIALIAALAGAVSLLYNSIDMFSNTPFSGSDDKPSQYYTSLQKPLAIILVVAAIVAFTGVASGIASFIVKNQKAKTACLVISLVVVAAFLAFIIAASYVWQGDYNKSYEYYADKFPHYITTSYQISQKYAIYSGVMAVLIPQLVYFTVIAAVLLTVYLMDKKSATKAVEANDINSENKGE
ncbi:MAG: hypothetical protein K2O28_01865 [Clostridia bacterium]|nr:hypothetical protein [Clostridia bacterium]